MFSQNKKRSAVIVGVRVGFAVGDGRVCGGGRW